MITEKDLQEAIAECQGVRSPKADTCIKLAAYYTIKEHLYPEKKEEQFAETGKLKTAPEGYSYSFSADPDKVKYSGKSEFSELINNRDASEIWPLMDELMETLKIINPRLYNGVMRKLEG